MENNHIEIPREFRGENYILFWNQENGSVWIDTAPFIDKGNLTHDKKAENRDHAIELGYELLTKVSWVADRLS